MYHEWKQTVYTTVVGKQDGRRSCGRPKRGGKDRDIPVEMYMKNITFENDLNLFS